MGAKTSFKAAVLALAAAVPAGSAQAIDPFFPDFGNTGIDVVHYDLDLNVYPRPGSLVARAGLKIVALHDLKRFQLDLSGLTVSGVAVDGQPARFRQSDGKLTITPPSEIPGGDVFNVTVLYAGTPKPIEDPTDPSYELGWFKYRDSSYVVSEPVGASTFYPANDEPNDKATFTIAVTVPSGFTGVANGVLTRTTPLSGGRKQFVWEMRQPMTTWLATVHVNRFNVRVRRAADGTPLRFYYTGETPPSDVDGQALASRMLSYFELLLGNYPFDSYGSVIVDDPGLYYALETQAMSTFPQDASDELIVAHELAHQWFGNAVSVAHWRDLWIAEGAATYFELLWPHRNDPAAFHAEMRGVYDYVEQESIGPAVVEKPEQMFTGRTYYRGALALYALQLEVGDRMFFKILRRFYHLYSGGNVTSTDFINVAVRLSGKASVRRILVDWLYERPVPPLPGAGPSIARSGPVPQPDVFGMRCGPVRHRGAPETCAGQPSASLD